jgi:DNA modification methylase
MMDYNRLICGDAIKEMTHFTESCFELVIADPPYNLGKDYGNNHDLKAWNDYDKFTIEWLTEAIRVLKPTGSIYVFMGVKFISRLFIILEEEFNLNFNGWITWHYTQGMGRKNGFSPRHEDILYFTKSKKYTFNLDDIRIPQKYYRERNNMTGANPGDVWQFSHVHYCSEEREKHPTQKPEALAERIIKASSNIGDAVLDPFVGSGTTCKVAEILKRKWIGIDINPEYISMSQKRISSNLDQFDSIDPRIQREPLDIPSDVIDKEESQITLF